jgi:hypothetical protein
LISLLVTIDRVRMGRLLSQMGETNVYRILEKPLGKVCLKKKMGR